MKNLSSANPTANAEIARLRRRVRNFDREIAFTENLMDAGARTLESARRERERIVERIDRLILQDALDYPSVIGV